MSKRTHVASDLKPQGNDKSPVVILIFNVLVLIALWFILLVPPVNDVLVTFWEKLSSCPPSTFQTLGAALILLEVLHLTWRFFGHKLVEQMGEAGVPDIVGIGQLLLKIVGLLHPHVLDNRVLWALFVVALLVASALVLLPLPGRAHDNSIRLSNFTVQRTTPPSTETINPGDTLLVIPGEIVHISANAAGPAGFKCTWFTTPIGTKLGIGKCSLTYCAPRSAKLDNIAVLVSSPCRTDPEVFAGFHIRVAQTTP